MSHEQPATAAATATERLLRLERILAEESQADAPAGPGSLDVPPAVTDRMVRLTAELRARLGQDPDAADVVTMRLLLKDYVTAVTSLRALADDTNARISGVQQPLKRATRRVRDLLGLEVAGGRPYLRARGTDPAAPASGNGGQSDPGHG